MIRYREETPNPYFPGQPRTESEYSQPPYYKPHWEICEPRIRKELKVGSILFFIPRSAHKKGWKVKYVMKVERILDETKAKKELDEKWWQFYKNQVWCHRGKGRGNIVVGGEWFSVRGEGEEIRHGDFWKKRVRNNGARLDSEQASILYRRLWPFRETNRPSDEG